MAASIAWACRIAATGIELRGAACLGGGGGGTAAAGLGAAAGFEAAAGGGADGAAFGGGGGAAEGAVAFSATAGAAPVNFNLNNCWSALTVAPSSTRVSSMMPCAGDRT